MIAGVQQGLNQPERYHLKWGITLKMGVKVGVKCIRKRKKQVQ
jgi:hypothetical protein